MFDYTSIIDYRDFVGIPEFENFVDDEFSQLVENYETAKTRLSGKVATINEMRKDALLGKAVEWVLIQNTRLKKLEESDLYKHRKFDTYGNRMIKCLKYHDLFDDKTNEIIEIKVWRKEYHDMNSNGMQKLIAGYNDWVYIDRILIYEKMNAYMARFSEQVNFTKHMQKVGKK